MDKDRLELLEDLKEECDNFFSSFQTSLDDEGEEKVLYIDQEALADLWDAWNEVEQQGRTTVDTMDGVH